MCGIFGAVAAPGQRLRHPECVGRMAAELRHRGPDGERIVGDDRTRLGARRLAVMDLTTGAQPFQSPDGNVWMVCNGEIYNAPDLRRQATAWGYPFRSHGDIETIVPFYERFGPRAIERLDGMFGLAVWDARVERLLLARDRAGEKPLFWTEIGGELRFASEIQALLVFPDQPRCVDPHALALYRALGYVPAPHTLFAGIRKLPPAGVLEFGGGRVDVRSYWSAARAAGAASRLDSAATLRTTVLDAVARQLMSDVPLGVFTSGGLDSSLLVAAAARAMPGGAADRLHTYAARFVEPGYDESPHAAAVTREIASVHHVVTADEPALERALHAVSQAMAEPIGDPAILPTWLLAQAAGADVKVILSGEGADELFGGYPTYLGHQAAGWWGRLPPALARGAAWIVERWPASSGNVTLEFLLKQFVRGADRPWLERHLRWFGAGGPTAPVLEELRAVLRDFPQADALNQALWFDFMTYLPDNLLVKVDRATMLASIEARAPYLDRAVLELVLPAPSALKVRGPRSKVILKEAARGLVPEAVIARRKRGLAVPVARWLTTGLRPLADRLLHTPLWAEHRSGRANHARRLWPRLTLALWAERWGLNVDEGTSHDS